jgi:hypothetical protein
MEKCGTFTAGVEENLLAIFCFHEARATPLSSEAFFQDFIILVVQKAYHGGDN